MSEKTKYTARAERYNGMKYNRCGESELRLIDGIANGF